MLSLEPSHTSLLGLCCSHVLLPRPASENVLALTRTHAYEPKNTLCRKETQNTDVSTVADDGWDWILLILLGSVSKMLSKMLVCFFLQRHSLRGPHNVCHVSDGPAFLIPTLFGLQTCGECLLCGAWGSQTSGGPLDAHTDHHPSELVILKT